MEISVEQYQAYLKDNEPERRVVSGNYTAEPTSVAQLATALIQSLQELLDEGRIGFSSYEVVAAPAVTFSLEMSPINLPMVDAKKANQFFTDETAPVTLKVYLVTRSEFINVSKLHIDYFADSDAEFSAERLATMLSEKWAVVEDHYKNPPALQPAAAVTKATTKKTATKKKTTAKKSTAKKRTTKTATAEKATSKKTTTLKKTTKTSTTKKKATAKKATSKTEK